MSETDDPRIHVQATEYEVSVFPPEHQARRYFTLTLKYRGRGLWGIFDGPYCFDAQGCADVEPLTTSRTDAWIDEHRFDFDTALKLTEKFAPELNVNGRRALDVLRTGGFE